MVVSEVSSRAVTIKGAACENIEEAGRGYSGCPAEEPDVFWGKFTCLFVSLHNGLLLKAGSTAYILVFSLMTW